MSKVINSALRKKILEAKPKEVESFYVPDWDVTVWLRELTLGERDEFEALQMKRGEDGSITMETRGLKARLIILCACEEDGSPIFTMEDEALVNGLGAATMETIFAACQRINRMRKEDVDSPLASKRNDDSASG